MNVFEAIEKRRAVKHFDPNHSFNEEEKNNILNLAIQTPTAFNIQNWRFVVIADPEVRKKIRAVSWDQAQVTDASMLIILCADLKAWNKSPERYWKDGPQEVRDILLPAIDGYYNGKPQVERDEAMRSCGMVAQTLMLTAKAMGYDSCPMDGFDFDEVAKIINLPDDHVISMFVAIGKKAKDVWPKPGQLPLEDVVINNTF